MTHDNGSQKFDQALEAMLEGRKTPPETLGEEDQAILVLASDLAQTDFSAAYGERAALRRRLLESRKVGSLQGDKRIMFAYKRRMAMAVAAVAVVGVLAFARFSPALAESRQGVATWLWTAGVPEQAVVVVVGPPAVAVMQGQDGSTQTLTYRMVSSMAEAQAAATFTVRQPTALPAGFALKSIAVSPEGNRVVLEYENGSGTMQFTLRQYMAAHPSDAAPSTSKGDIVVQLGGKEIPANVIRWAANGVAYELSGTLSEADLQVVASSVR